jgi:enoyl-CoA hydratase
MIMMDLKYFEVEINEGIAVLTFAREKVLNALNSGLLEEGISVLSELKKQDIRVLVVTGKGPKAFVAGADIAELKELDGRSARTNAELGHGFMNALEQFPAPVIAAVNGFALGGGLEVALSCDLRFASETARLGLPEVTLGIIPGYGGTQRLSRLIGRGKARQYVFSGKPVKAAQALADGLVEEVFPAEELMEKTLEFAKSIAANAPLALRAAKRALNRGCDLDLTTGLQIEIAEFSGTLDTQDSHEGLGAFLEKRKSEFTGK